jgi:hypothetical protein
MKSKKLLLILPLTMVSCGSVSHLKNNSKISKVGLITPSQSERSHLIYGGIRDEILLGCPKGSTKAHVDQYARQNFSKEIHTGNPDRISFRINERLLWPIAHSWQQVSFIFDESDRLIDVQVSKDGIVWLSA